MPAPHATLSSSRESLASFTTSFVNWRHSSLETPSCRRRVSYLKPEERESAVVGIENWDQEDGCDRDGERGGPGDGRRASEAPCWLAYWLAMLCPYT